MVKVQNWKTTKEYFVPTNHEGERGNKIQKFENQLNSGLPLLCTKLIGTNFTKLEIIQWF